VKTLIIYGTKHGTAGECAQMIAAKLNGEVDVCSIKDGVVPEISKYDRVIIGGPIYAGSMHREVREFCAKNLEALKGKRIGLFICCMNKSAEETQLNNAFPEELLEACRVKDSFGGQFKFSEMSFIERGITKMVTKFLAKEDKNLASVDFKKDLNIISLDKIDRFAELMNS